MPYYKPLKRGTITDRKRTVAGLQRLRQQFRDNNFPIKKASASLILGTWNIRNFDDDRFNYGPRTKESLYYIAEIISHYDVMAVQEICVDLWPLDNLMRLLGDQYDYIVTDVPHSSLGGNQERLGFIYDKHKVRFTGVAGEIVLPDKLLISDALGKGRQFSRTPFGVEFQSGWFKFTFSTVHIYFGSNQGNTPQFKRRVKEIKAIANYLAKEAKNADSNHILVGDFNIKEKGSEGFNALVESGFKTVQNRKGSNKDQTKYYDQISFRSKKNELAFLEPERDDRVIQFFDSIYRKDDFRTYKPVMKKMINAKIRRAKSDLEDATSKTARNKHTKRIEKLEEVMRTDENFEKYYDQWRTFQSSDHLPLWVEIKIDFSDQYLNYLSTYRPK